MEDSRYSLENLLEFEFNLKLDKFLEVQEKKSIFDYLKEVNLSKFQLENFGSLKLFLDRITEEVDFPLFIYESRKPFQNFSIDIAVYSKKMQLNINKLERSFKLSKGRVESDSIEMQTLNMDLIKEVEVDFNYLTGLIMGKTNNLSGLFDVNGKILCKCKNMYYDKYFMDLTNLTFNVLDKEDYKVKGLIFEYSINVDDIIYTIDSRIGRNIKNEDTYRINYESKMHPPFDIKKTMGILFKEMNEINETLSEM